ncbi:MAG: carboxypeptidase-like regulatory domain-containing protein, partial [Desulfuromonadales bacterium]
LLCLFLMCGCSWYSKPAYWGRVVDAETGEPIKGVHVTIIYQINVQRLVEQGTKHVTEFYLVTGQDGRFETPTVRSILGPLSWDKDVVFSIDKEGYAYFSADISDCMSSGCEEKDFYFHGDVNKKFTIGEHLIKLPKL